MDKLVERLREPQFADRIHTVSLHNEAADRIEVRRHLQQQERDL